MTIINKVKCSFLYGTSVPERVMLQSMVSTNRRDRKAEFDRCLYPASHSEGQPLRANMLDCKN